MGEWVDRNPTASKASRISKLGVTERKERRI